MVISLVDHNEMCIRDRPCNMLVIYSGDILAIKLSQGRCNQTHKTLPTIAFNKSKKRLCIGERFKIGVWNVRGLAHKEVKLQLELKLMRVDITIIPETKNTLKGLKELKEKGLY